MFAVARTLALGACAALLACGDRDDRAPQRTARMETPTTCAPVDAGAAIDSRTAPKTRAPRPDEDDDWLDPIPAGPPSWTPAKRKKRDAQLIHIILRSTPPGAMAFVDGTLVGATPTYWEGETTGKPRDFVFALRGYVARRYRFVPVTSGDVHATLDKLGKDLPDAGVEAHAQPPPG